MILTGMTGKSTYYDLLGIAKSADLVAIKRAYRDQIRLHHPDRYAPDLSRARSSGDVARVRQLEHQIEEAKRKTQAINHAYATLSDVQTRTRYDDSLKPRPTTSTRTQRQPVHRDSEYDRRTVKARPHRATPITKVNSQDAIPLAMIGILFILLLFGANLVSLFWGFGFESVTDPQGMTSQPGFVSAQDLQSTAILEHATKVARLDRAAQPTATPRGIEASIASADAFYIGGSYDLAIEGYSEALEGLDATAELYVKRGRAYTALYRSGLDEEAFTQALEDFARALLLDETYVEAYAERGLLYYERWRLTRTEDDARSARINFETYQASGSVNERITRALEEIDG